MKREKFAGNLAWQLPLGNVHVFQTVCDVKLHVMILYFLEILLLQSQASGFFLVCFCVVFCGICCMFLHGPQWNLLSSPKKGLTWGAVQVGQSRV